VEKFSTFLGSGLLEELRSTDGMAERDAKDWIMKRSGRIYDPAAHRGLEVRSSAACLQSSGPRATAAMRPSLVA
jgi:hypothetical protein